MRIGPRYFHTISHQSLSLDETRKVLSLSKKGPVCVLLCFIKPILGNRYGPGVVSLLI